jgi:hypothetical protein
MSEIQYCEEDVIFIVVVVIVIVSQRKASTRMALSSQFCQILQIPVLR